MKNIFLFLIFITTIIACGSGSSATPAQKIESDRWDAVMANHDVVMPMMGTTHKVRKGLKKLIKEDLSTDKSGLIKTTILLENLDKADESMMDWMQGFQKLGKLQETKTHEEILQYLAKEEQKINKVRELMETSIAEGERFLKGDRK